MMYRTIRMLNLIAAGLLAGNELGTWAVVHRSLAELDPQERLRGEQELTRRYGRIMPAWMGATLASSVAATVAGGRKPGFPGTLVGTLLFAAMLASTRLGNVPINARTLELTEDDIEEFERLRDRWDRLHTLRVALTTTGFAALASGALAGERR